MSNRVDLVRAQVDANDAAAEAERRRSLEIGGDITAALLAVRLEIRALAILLDTGKGVRA